MDQQALISVIMPVYNSEPYLELAIQSILDQTYTNFELIIAYDKSKDNSFDIIKKFKKTDNRILICAGEKRGLVKALNDALLLSKGKYIARMDADDISLVNRFEKQIKFINNQNLDICGSHYLLIDQKNNITGLNLVPISHQTCFLSLGTKVPFAHPNVMIKKDFLDKYNLQYGQSKYKIAEDYDLWIRMYEKGAKFGNVNDILFKYRILEDSLSKINLEGLLKDSISMKKEFIENNKDDIYKHLNCLPSTLNEEEQALIVRIVFQLFLKEINLKGIKYLKSIENKIIICTILSELKNI